MKVSEKIIQYLDDVEHKILDGFAVNNNSLQDVRDIRRNIQAIIKESTPPPKSQKQKMIVKILEDEEFYPNEPYAYNRLKKAVYLPSKERLTISTYLVDKKRREDDSKQYIMLFFSDIVGLKSLLSDIKLF